MATEYYLHHNKPEEAVRNMTMIFYSIGDDGRAIQLAQKERNEKRAANLRDASVFWGEVEPCDRVWIMPSVAAHLRARIREAYAAAGVPISELTDKQANEPPSTAKEPETSEEGVADYRSLTNKELRALAEQRGIDVRRAYTKDDLVSRLKTGAHIGGAT